MTHPFDLLPLEDNANFIFTPCPGTKQSDLISSIQTLKQAGATSVITMLSDEELAQLGVSDLGKSIESAGLTWYQLPVEDEAEPDLDFDERFSEVRNELLERINQGETIAIHCRGGSGRTGLMAATLLLERGDYWFDVKPLIQSIRPKALSLEPHLNFLKKRFGIV